MSCHTFLTPGTILKNARYQGLMFPIFELSLGFFIYCQGQAQRAGPAGKVIPVVCLVCFPSGVTEVHAGTEGLGTDLQANTEKAMG